MYCGFAAVITFLLAASLSTDGRVANRPGPQSSELKPPFPQVDREFQSKYCKVEYTASKEADARQLGADADSSLESMSHDLAPLDPYLMRDFDCTIVQFAVPLPGIATEAQEQTQSENGGRSFRVFLLALSSIPATSRTVVGEPKDEDFSYKTIADELSAVLFDRVTHDKGSGWRFHQAPDLFVQGIEGYFGMTHSTPHEQNLTLPLYVTAVGANSGEVSFRGAIRVRNPYLGGLAVVAFLYDVYGANRVNALLMSPKPTFDEAFSDNFGDFGSIRGKYNAWIAKRCALTRKSR